MSPVPLRFRKHLRIQGFDYRSHHAYFVTICTANREPAFGHIESDEMHLSRRGIIVQACWQDIPNHHPFIELDAMIIMPNHVHGILAFVGDAPVAATPASPLPRGPQPASLGSVVGSFKSAVSRSINRLRPGAAAKLWQTNYFEHIVRNDKALYAIRDYILTNPARWQEDELNPRGSGIDSVEGWIRKSEMVWRSEEATQASQLREGKA
jgi:REP element-mobilizing transposase RayT